MFDQKSAESRLEAALAHLAPTLQDAGVVVSLVRRQADQVELHLKWTPGACPERINRALGVVQAAFKRQLPTFNCRLVAADGRRLELHK